MVETVKVTNRRLSWAQEDFLRYLSDGEWHSWSGKTITGSGIRGLISRGLIERRCENETAWMRDGEFRLKLAALSARGTDEWVKH